MEWLFLIIAGTFEVVWAVALKYSQGFTRLYPSIITIIGMIVSFYFLSIAVKTLPIGSAYAVWTSIGIIGTVIFGMVFLNEPKDLVRIFFILLIIIGIVGLNLTSASN